MKSKPYFNKKERNHIRKILEERGIKCDCCRSIYEKVALD